MSFSSQLAILKYCGSKLKKGLVAIQEFHWQVIKTCAIKCPCYRVKSQLLNLSKIWSISSNLHIMKWNLFFKIISMKFFPSWLPLRSAVIYGDQSGWGLFLRLIKRSKKVLLSTMSSFTAGKVNFSNTVLITHERAMPSGPVDTSKILHLFKCLEYTRSWLPIYFLIWIHLVRSIKIRAYSLCSHFQKMSSRPFVSF